MVAAAVERSTAVLVGRERRPLPTNPRLTRMREWRDQLAQGSIVWARIPDPRGLIKRRPVVILTDAGEIVLNGPIVGVAVTTSFPDPPPRIYVELPCHSRGHPATRLTRRSAAVCNWLVQLQPSDVEEIKGVVPTQTMLSIVNRVRELNTPSR